MWRHVAYNQRMIKTLQQFLIFQIVMSSLEFMREQMNIHTYRHIYIPVKIVTLHIVSPYSGNKLHNKSAFIVIMCEEVTHLNQ